MVISDDQIDEFLSELSSIAMEEDPYEFGLPRFDNCREKLRAAVREFIENTKESS